MHSQEFLHFLQRELVERCKRNPKYSLRAFSRSIGLSHATLSHVLRGTRKLTPKACLKIGKALGLSDSDLEGFVSSGKQKALYPRKKVHVLSSGQAGTLSDWYFDTILELTHVEAFRPDPKWISRKLGITASEVHFAVEALKKVGQLKVLPSGKWVDTSRDNTNISDPLHSTASARKLQQRLLDRAAKAIDQVDFPLRDNTSLTAAIDVDDLPAIKEKIAAFRRDLWAFMQRSGTKPNQVYQLCVALYPVCKNEKE